MIASVASGLQRTTLVEAIGVARILSAGLHFFTKKVDERRLFSRRRLHIHPNLKTVLQIDSCSGWGVHFVSCGGMHLHIFPVN